MVQKRQLFRYAVDTFISTLEKVTKRKVSYKCNTADTTAWSNFITEYPTVGEEFVLKFLQFGFQNWFDDNDVDHTYKIRFNWIFGKQAVKRWNKNSITTNVYLTRKGIKSKCNISVDNKSKVPDWLGELRTAEECFKQKYHNTKRGFLWCVANTTLYHHRSNWCVGCDYKEDCKRLLLQEYPKIYVKRGYAE